MEKIILLTQLGPHTHHLWGQHNFKCPKCPLRAPQTLAFTPFLGMFKTTGSLDAKNGAQTKRPKTKRPKGQNVPRQNVPRDKTSQGQNVPRTKRPKGQNVPRDKTSQGKKNATF